MVTPPLELSATDYDYADVAAFLAIAMLRDFAEDDDAAVPLMMMPVRRQPAARLAPYDSRAMMPDAASYDTLMLYFREEAMAMMRQAGSIAPPDA